MMPYEVGKTFIIRVSLLSIETYKELCSEKDGLPVIKTKETLTGYTHKLFTLRRKKGTGGRSPHHSQFPSMTVLHIFYACGTINRKQAF